MGFAGGDQRHVAQGLATCRAVLRRHPKVCDCWCNLGAALRALGRKEEVFRDVRRELEALLARPAGVASSL